MSLPGDSAEGRVVPVAECDVLVVDPRAEQYAQRLAAAMGDVRFGAAAGFGEVGAALDRVTTLITMGVGPGVGFDAAVVEKMPRLRWIQSLLAGYDHLTAALEARPDVLLTTMRGIHGPQMAETVLLHMLVLARSVRGRVDDQSAHRWRPGPQPLLHGRTAAVVGMGASGQHIARLCHCLGMTVHAVSRTRAPAVAGVDRVFSREQLTEAASLADFLVLVLAADDDTSHLVDASVLAAMKPTAYLINVARGSVLDEQALLQALSSGRIAGAGLDVFAAEPLPSDNALWDQDNVFITPHIGGYSDTYYEQTLSVVLPNLRAFASGRPQDLVNRVGA